MIKIKVAIISDVHGNVVALNEVIKDAELNKVDKYVFLGDLVTEFPFSNEVLDIVKQKSDIVLRGNKEEYLIDYDKERYTWKNIQFQNTIYMYNTLTKENFEYIKNLPVKRSVELDGYKILFCHASPESVYETLNQSQTELFEKYTKDLKEDALIFGHTHAQGWHDDYNGKLVLNPGACGVSHSDIAVTEYTIIEIEDGKLIDIDHRMLKFDLEKLKEMIQNDDILKYDNVLMNICFWSLDGNFMKRHQFFAKAKERMLEKHGKRHRDDAKGIYTYFKLYSDEIWTSTLKEFEDYVVFKKVEENEIR